MPRLTHALPIAVLLLAGIAVAQVGTARDGSAQAGPDRRGSGWLKSDAELRAAVSDSTHVRRRVDGSEETEYHSEDGRVAYLFDGCLWSGQWWVAEEEICYRYPELSGAMEHCFFLRDGPAGLEFWSVERTAEPRPLAVVEQLLDGNPRGLSLEAGGRCQET